MPKPERSKMLACAVITLGLTVILPLIGVLLTGSSIAPYLKIPPEGQARDYPGFTWIAFIGIWLLFFVLLAAWLATAKATTTPPRSGPNRPFPRWGWIGLWLVVAFWILAWTPTPIDWIRRYTFPPLWLGFIITINALLYRRTGRCPLTHETSFFLILFPASAAFWWLFEYLNRFVDNWIYLSASEIGSLNYFIHASLSFATVLPAVYSTRQWLGSFPRLQARFSTGPDLRIPAPKISGCLILVFFASALTAIGLVPEFFFPFLWIGPLGIWISIGLISDRQHPWPEIHEGDWRAFLSWALAALVCGFFWELWNFYAVPKWEYQIPWFEAFYIFEMPISGYLGYLPFGLECAIAVGLLRSIHNSIQPGHKWGRFVKAKQKT